MPAYKFFYSFITCFLAGVFVFSFIAELALIIKIIIGLGLASAWLFIWQRKYFELVLVVGFIIGAGYYWYFNQQILSQVAKPGSSFNGQAVVEKSSLFSTYQQVRAAPVIADKKSN